jgi:hypothetical protein
MPPRRGSPTRGGGAIELLVRHSQTPVSSAARIRRPDLHLAHAHQGVQNDAPVWRDDEPIERLAAVPERRRREVETAGTRAGGLLAGRARIDLRRAAVAPAPRPEAVLAWLAAFTPCLPVESPQRRPFGHGLRPSIVGRAVRARSSQHQVRRVADIPENHPLRVALRRAVRQRMDHVRVRIGLSAEEVGSALPGVATTGQKVPVNDKASPRGGIRGHERRRNILLALPVSESARRKANVPRDMGMHLCDDPTRTQNPSVLLAD